MEKALIYEKGKGGCHLVSPEKLKKICPALIQVLASASCLVSSEWEINRDHVSGPEPLCVLSVGG